MVFNDTKSRQSCFHYLCADNGSHPFTKSSCQNPYGVFNSKKDAHVSISPSHMQTVFIRNMFCTQVCLLLLQSVFWNSNKTPQFLKIQSFLLIEIFFGEHCFHLTDPQLKFASGPWTGTQNSGLRTLNSEFRQIKLSFRLIVLIFLYLHL